MRPSPSQADVMHDTTALLKLEVATKFKLGSKDESIYGRKLLRLHVEDLQTRKMASI